jgi:MerR family transcriptional regulator, light-induced transcriptional regulator
LKYLGRASDITLDKIPIEYRNDTKILSFLSAYASKTYNRKDISISKLKVELFEAFSDGNLEAAIAVYRNYCKNYETADFYENLLKPLMYQVGDLWEQNKIDVATEHVCSNVARGLIQAIIDETTRRKRKDQTILLCSPEGEQHNLGCCVIESVLLARGYKVLNASPSAPSDSIIRYVKDAQLDAILISVTLLENMGSAERLIRTIRAASNIPILIGGQALLKVTDERRNIIISSKVQIMQKVQLDEVLRVIRQVTRQRK